MFGCCDCTLGTVMGLLVGFVDCIFVLFVCWFLCWFCDWLLCLVGFGCIKCCVVVILDLLFGLVCCLLVLEFGYLVVVFNKFSLIPGYLRVLLCFCLVNVCYTCLQLV